MSTFNKLTFFISSTGNQSGRATESWWFPSGFVTSGIDPIAQARANLLGFNGQITAAGLSQYNTGPNNSLIKVGRLAAYKGISNNGWFPSKSAWPSVSSVGATAADKNVGIPVSITLAGVYQTFATAPYPPLILTQDCNVCVPAGNADYAAASAWLATASNSYTSQLVSAGALKYLRNYPAKYPIVSIEAGTCDGTGAEIVIAGNQTGVFMPSLPVSVHGRTAKRGVPHLLKDPISGDHTLQYVNFDIPTQTTHLGLSSTCRTTDADSCRKNGWVSLVGHNFLSLVQWRGYPQGKGRRGSRIRTVGGAPSL